MSKQPIRKDLIICGIITACACLFTVGTFVAVLIEAFWPEKKSPFGGGGSGTVVSAPMPTEGEVASAYRYTFPRVPDAPASASEPGWETKALLSPKVKWDAPPTPALASDNITGTITTGGPISWVTESSLSISDLTGPTTLALECGIKINLKTGAVHIPDDLTLDEASRKFWESLQKAFPIRTEVQP